METFINISSVAKNRTVGVLPGTTEIKIVLFGYKLKKFTTAFNMTCP